MNEPYKITLTLQREHTRQVGTAPDGVALALLIIGYSGPVALIEDGVHVGDFPTMAAARTEAQNRYQLRATGDNVGADLLFPAIRWTTVP